MEDTSLTDRLLAAAAQRDWDTVDTLLAAGARDTPDGSALMFSAGTGHVRRLLLVRQRYGRDALGRALYWAAAGGHVEDCAALLLFQEEDEKNAVVVDAWHLQVASKEGHAEVLKMLLRQCQNADIELALQAAIMRGHRVICDILLQRDPQRTLDAAFSTACILGLEAGMNRNIQTLLGLVSRMDLRTAEIVLERAMDHDGGARRELCVRIAQKHPRALKEVMRNAAAGAAGCWSYSSAGQRRRLGLCAALLLRVNAEMARSIRDHVMTSCCRNAEAYHLLVRVLPPV